MPISYEMAFQSGVLQEWPVRGPLLDIGTRDGEHMAVYANMGFEVYGLERDPDMVQKAVSSHLCVFQGVFPDVPAILDRQYTLVTMSEIVYYLDDMRTSLDWVHKHLTDNGRLLIQFHNSESQYYVNGYPDERYGPDLVWRPSKPVVDFWLDTCGFQPVKSYGFMRSTCVPYFRGEPLTMKNADRILILAEKKTCQ